MCKFNFQFHDRHDDEDQTIHDNEQVQFAVNALTSHV